MTNIELYQKLFEKNGELQLVVAIEELSELQKALSKHLRKKSDIENIVEEIADVKIVIEQLIMYFDCDLSVARVMGEKLARTLELLGTEDCSEL